jgi:hypothetical protein
VIAEFKEAAEGRTGGTAEGRTGGTAEGNTRR